MSVSTPTTVPGQPVSQPGAAVPRKREGMGCFAIGCLTSVLLLAGIALTLYFGLKAVAGKVIGEFSQDAPQEITPVTYTPDEAKAVVDRYNQFVSAAENHQPTPPLTFTGREINVLIANHPKFAPLRDLISVDIVGDQIGGKVSFPLEAVGFPGKYVNGSAKFKVGLTNGILVLTVDEMTMKGKPLPEDFLGQLRTHNLAQEMTNDPDVAKWVSQAEAVEVKDGKLTIKLKGAPSPTAK